MPNWLDTTGLGHGFLTVRYTYEEAPPKEQWPTLRVEKVAFDDIRRHLPADTGTVTPLEPDPTMAATLSTSISFLAAFLAGAAAVSESA